MWLKRVFLIYLISWLSTACSQNETEPAQDSTDFFTQYGTRKFQMGFTTWPYAPTLAAVDDTYDFLDQNTDLYSEHIDASIPWKSWIDGTPLPIEFTENITNRANRRLSSKKLNLSVSLLNLERSDLASDFDGTTPSFADADINLYAEAYFQHLVYLTERLNPEYLILAIEINELVKNAPQNWPAYQDLIGNVRSRIKEKFPNLPISESITLHNFYKPNVPNPAEFIDEMTTYANEMEFVSISHYPHFTGADSKDEFRAAFDFLHSKINRPIAFVETGMISENLISAEFGLAIPSSENLQNVYLEELLLQAQNHNYQYIIWWTYRDYDALLEAFPEEQKALGGLWLSTGIVNEDGREKRSKETWDLVFRKELD